MYNSKLVTKLINNIMYDGKRGVAQKIVYDAFKLVEEKSGKNALEAFQEALNNVMPVLEVKARRIGGSTYQVPMEVREERRQTLGLRWIRTYSRNRSERTMAEKLAGEIVDALNSTGGAFKKKEETHRMAEANRAFAHYKF
jgi:small subunit ribosomal protein S7